MDFEATHAREGIPLFSVESFSPVRDFDVFGFSLQAEINYSNVPNMLDLAGIPVLRGTAATTDPIVIGGARASRTPSRSRTSSTRS